MFLVKLILVISVNKKYMYVIIILLFLSMLFLGGSIADNNTSTEDYDSAFYVDDTNNVFIKFGKVIDRCCFFIVDIIISGISSVFQTILGY